MKKEWRLYKWQANKNYPSIHYLWVDPDDIIRYERPIQNIGYLPSANLTIWIGATISEFNKDMRTGVEYPEAKKIKTKMTQEELSKGFLLF